MSEEVLVRAENVGKKFCRDLKRSLYYGVQDAASDLFLHKGSRSNLRKQEFWANRGINFELRRGECLGLIGRNGAGKTTLLKMLNGLLKPDEGHIEMKGRIGALIALNAGFNPVLTGRENIFVNGAVLGLSRAEIKARFDEIVDFAELEDFIDTPVRAYSSGMQVRLGFAVASTLQPDVLLLDEVLAVGDFAFRQKCMQRVKKFLDNDGTAIFVSHNLHQVQNICSEVMYLKKGCSLYLGPTNEGLQAYHNDIEEVPAGNTSQHSQQSPVSQPVVIQHLEVNGGTSAQTFGEITFSMVANSQVDIDGVAAGFSVWTQDDQVRLFTLRNDFERDHFSIKQGENRFSATINLPLCAGNYCLKAMLFHADTSNPIVRHGFENAPFHFTVKSGSHDPSLTKQSIHGEVVAINASEIRWDRQ
ncbi:MAG: O-antigen export system ATP-binding protein [Puniceicoccaceae bacterium 5H]|nr:MAG: O-antigen export system ATP-binding protein [Puniceicoccaceae bacterium 5H]